MLLPRLISSEERARFIKQFPGRRIDRDAYIWIKEGVAHLVWDGTKGYYWTLFDEGDLCTEYDFEDKELCNHVMLALAMTLANDDLYDSWQALVEAFFPEVLNA